MKIEKHEQPDAAISLVNAFAENQSVDFFIDHIQQNETPLAYGEHSPYIAVPGGYRTVTVTQSNTFNVLLPDGDAGLSPGKQYTLFLTKNRVNAADSVAFMITLDSLYEPAEGRARLRFANLTPDAPAINIYLKGDTIPFIRNQAFKTASIFRSIGTTRKTFEIREAGKDSIKQEFQVNLEAGKIYTVFTKGRWETDFSTAVMVNK